MPGDWNAFFGFGTNILVNLLTLSGAAAVRPADAGRAGLQAHPPGGRADDVHEHDVLRLARLSLAKKTGRTDVCALPSGISVPHMFIVTLVIMLPVKLATGDPMKGWQAGLTWVFIQSFVLMARRLPRADRPQDHPEGRAARRAGRRLDHLHLDEARAWRCS